MFFDSYHRAPFFEGYRVCKRSKKEVGGNYFHKITLVALFTIHVNLHAMEFLFIFGEANFMELQKSTNSVKFTALEKRVPYGILKYLSIKYRIRRNF